MRSRAPVKRTSVVCGKTRSAFRFSGECRAGTRQEPCCSSYGCVLFLFLMLYKGVAAPCVGKLRTCVVSLVNLRCAVSVKALCYGFSYDYLLSHLDIILALVKNLELSVSLCGTL